jgi:hypothetical protein
MPNYRVRPGSIPKHLKLPLQPPVAAQRGPDGRPPIRNSPSVGDSNAADTADTVSTPRSSSWFTLPRFRAQESSWFSRQRRLRDVAKAHPHARLRDPKSIRIYDLIAKTSVPSQFFSFTKSILTCGALTCLFLSIPPLSTCILFLILRPSRRTFGCGNRKLPSTVYNLPLKTL